MRKFDTVIFDFGGVLIDWNPRYLYRKIFNSEEDVDWFLENVCTHEWNVLQDAGRDWDEAIRLLINDFPHLEQEIRSYYDRWPEMLGGPIPETLDILISLSKTKFRLLGLTNWSHQTFPIAKERYAFLSLFEGIVVSGVEKLIKPDPKIFHLIMSRFDLEPEKCIFIDDNMENIRAAQNLGITSVHFTNPKNLRKKLEDLISF